MRNAITSPQASEYVPDCAAPADVVAWSIVTGGNGRHRMATHRIGSAPETVPWGVFDANFPPLITVNSGDAVVLECVSGGPEDMPMPTVGLTIPAVLAAIHFAKIPRAPGHLITGPVAIAGAEPGDMFEVHIDKIDLGCDWGCCGFRPLAGTNPGALSGKIPVPHPGGSRPPDLAPALGNRIGPVALFRRDEGSASARLWSDLDHPAT